MEPKKPGEMTLEREARIYEADINRAGVIATVDASIANLADLCSALARWQRDGQAPAEDNIPAFIACANLSLNELTLIFGDTAEIEENILTTAAAHLRSTGVEV